MEPPEDIRLLFLGSGPYPFNRRINNDKFHYFSRYYASDFISPVYPATLRTTRLKSVELEKNFTLYPFSYYYGSAIIKNLSNIFHYLTKALKLYYIEKKKFQIVISGNPLTTGLCALIIAKLTGAKSIIEVNQFLAICKKYAEFSDCSYYLLIPDQRQLISAQTVVACYKLGWDFESFNELSDAMWLLCKNFRKQGYAEKDIMIDFTGGQKVTSVVAAAITFNRKIKAQYVQTSDPWKVLSYDVIHASPDTGGFGT